MLELQKSEGVDISNDDLEKLEKLTQERVEVSVLVTYRCVDN